MTIKIELSNTVSNAALEAFALASGFGIIPEEGEPADEDTMNGIKAAIAAAHEAMVKEGTAVEGYADNLGLVRVLTIRLGGKP